MSDPLHRISTLAFYVLGTSFFIAYLLLRNGIALPWPEWWLRVADLPILMSAMCYGGTSLYKSVKPPKEPAPVLAACITIPLALLFFYFACVNYNILFVVKGV